MGLTVTIEQSAVGRPIPPGFLGLSTEYRGVEWYAGRDPQTLDPVFLRLVRNLTPGQRPVLRIGGDSTDWTWWPVRHMRRPPGVKYTLTKGWLRVTRAVAAALDARLILGINLAADSRRVAGVEARALLRGIGRRWIEALELGNEPELYGAYGWYQTADGRVVVARPHDWTFESYLRDFSRIARSLPPGTIAGPAAGSSLWTRRLSLFVAAQPRVAMLTIHRYALRSCGPFGDSTVSELLSNAAVKGLAQAVVRDTQLAHAHGIGLRSDEINSIACGGQPGVSDSFGAALWALDTLFEMARVGIDGVNFHTEPGSFNELFSVTAAPGGWEAYVHPEYYGLIMFVQAASPGARLLRLLGAVRTGVDIWATRAPDGQLHVVLINKRLERPRVIRLRIGWAAGSATVETLRAPSAYATTGVTLGGRSFGTETTTGVLPGTSTPTILTPAAHTYTVYLPAASASLLTLSGPHRDACELAYGCGLRRGR